MAKFSDARGEMWTPIPYSVLADDEWTSTRRADPRRGSTSLPAKTAPYTTTRGKLSQDECNDGAPARFTPSTLRDGLATSTTRGSRTTRTTRGRRSCTAAPNSTRWC